MTVLASVDVEVTAKLNPLEQALDTGRGKVNAFEKAATDSLGKVAAEANKAGDAMKKAADSSAAAQAKVVPVLKDVNNAAQAASIAETRLAMEMRVAARESERAANRLALQAKEATKLAAATNDAAKASERASAAANNLGTGVEMSAASAKRLGSSLGNAIGQIASGTPSIDVLANSARGGGAALLEMGGAVAAIGLTVGVVAGAVIGGAVAWNQYEEAAAASQLAVRGAGAAAGLTAGDFMLLAEASADAGNMTVKAARDIEGAIVQAGVGNREIIGDLIVVTKDYAALTQQEAVAAANELAVAFTGDRDAISEVLDKLGGLDDKTRQHIESLLRQNDLVGAQNALLRALQSETRGAADEVTGLARAWRDVTTWATNAFAAMGKEISLRGGGGSTGERLQFLQGIQNNGISGAANRMAMRAGIDTPLNQEVRRLDLLNRKEQATARATAAEHERNRVAREGRAAFDALVPGERQRAEIGTEIARIERSRAAGTLTDAQATQALAQAQLRLNAIDRREAGPKTPKGPSTARADQLRRDAEAMEATAKAGIDLAEAYLQSADAGLRAEAQRAALTQATRRGTDVEAQAQRQLALNISNAAAQGAKAVSASRQEIEARRGVNDAVRDGALTMREAQEWLEQDQSQRALRNMALVAEGSVREALTEIISAQGQAVEDLNREQARSAILQANENQERENDRLKEEIRLIGMSNAERRVAIAQYETLARLKAAGILATSPEGRAALSGAKTNANLENIRDAGDFMREAREAVEDQITAFGMHRATMGMSFQAAERFRKEQEFINAATRAGIELTPEQTESLRALASAYAEAADQAETLKEIEEAFDFAADSATDFFDDVIFGSRDADAALKNLLKSIGQALLKSALLGQGPLAGILGMKDSGGLFGALKTAGLSALGRGSGPAPDLAGLYHSGTRNVGSPTMHRVASPGLFVNAPRLHDGLAAGEFPAILEQGERVTSKRGVAEEQRQAGKGMQGPQKIEIKIDVSGANGDAEIERRVQMGVTAGLRQARAEYPGRAASFDALGT